MKPQWTPAFASVLQCNRYSISDVRDRRLGYLTLTKDEGFFVMALYVKKTGHLGFLRLGLGRVEGPRLEARGLMETP